MTNSNTFLPKIEYNDAGMSGNLTAFFEDFQLRCYYEFCGGSALVSICVPDYTKWESVTGKPVEERVQILTLMAHKVKQEKFSLPNVWFEITDKHITYYS